MPLQLRKAYGWDLLGVAIEYRWATEVDPGFMVPDTYTIWRTPLRKQLRNIFGKFHKNDMIL